jgi:hypothetical protein
MFSVDEVVAAVLPNVGRAREIELRVDADGYVVIDIVAPAERQAAQPVGQREPTADEVREGRPDTKPEADQPGDAPPSEPGPREEEARGLCRTPLFRAFLEVKTEEAALKVMAERCHVQGLPDLDRTRSNGMNLRHVVEEFEAWKIT